MIFSEEVERVGQCLAEVGLNRCQAVATSDLPPQVWLPGSSQPPTVAGEETTFLLIGHAGTAMWRHLTDNDPHANLDSDEDPIDRFSTETSGDAIREQWPTIDRQLLYPTDECPVDLVALGRAIGWHVDSPLGLGIHPEYGLWSAFRALWVLSAGLVSQTRPTPASNPDVCGTCVTHDCVSACPAEAVSMHERFGLTACFDHRAQPSSSCAETCLARLACPVGVQHRYGDTQMAYHYGISRPAGSS